MMNTNSGAGRTAAHECAAIAADLERLKVLITDAGDKLLASFNAVGSKVDTLGCADAERQQLMAAVAQAVTALQFQDMATQLTQHAQRRLNVLKDCVTSLSSNETDPLLATTRMQPVRQTGMGAGDIDLF